MRGTGYLSYAVSKVERLCKDLIIEHEIIRIFQQWQAEQYFSRESPVTRMVF